jgi:Histidine kinase-, DNA gyrase B-, and HSP90-like ATPase
MNTPRPATAPAVADPIEVGSFFLETLTTGMYENPFHCIREYIQNGFDAISDAVRDGVLKDAEGRVLIAVGGTGRNLSLSIRDNGTGIPLTRAYTTLVSLGASRKNPAQHAGFRGIGRLAGIAYCTTLRFTTKARGETEGTIVEYDCGLVRSFLKPGSDPQDVRQVVRESVKTRTFSETVEEHYTEVGMLGLTGLGVEFAEMERLQPYLRQVCPVDYADNFDFAEQIRASAASYGDRLGVIQVETRQKRERVSVHKPYKNSAPVGGSRRSSASSLYDIETFTSKEHGWYGWIGKSNFPGEITDETVAGVRFKVKNIQIGESRIIEDMAEELTASGTERRLQRWAVGEIFITNPQVVPNARRDGFEDNQAWREIRRDLKAQVARRVVRLIREASNSRSVLKRLSAVFDQTKSKLAVPKLTGDEKVKLEAEIKRHIEMLGSDKLAGADPKEISFLISKFKGALETLETLPVESPPAKTSEASSSLQGSGETGDTSSTSGAASIKSGILDIVYEVLLEELGEEEAKRLLELISIRLEE